MLDSFGIFEYQKGIQIFECERVKKIRPKYEIEVSYIYKYNECTIS